MNWYYIILNCHFINVISKFHYIASYIFQSFYLLLYPSYLKIYVHICLYLWKYLADYTASWIGCNSGVYKYVPFEMLTLCLWCTQHVCFLISYMWYVHILERSGHEQKWKNILILFWKCTMLFIVRLTQQCDVKLNYMQLM